MNCLLSSVDIDLPFPPAGAGEWGIAPASGPVKRHRARIAEVDPFAVFGLQTFLSSVVFGLLAWWYVWPWLRSIDRTNALTALTFVHALRPIGATVLVASVAATALPRDFTEQVAYGDLATSLLAVVTVIALRSKLGFAIALGWLTNTGGAGGWANGLA